MTMVRSEGNVSLKNPVTPPGIDPGTIRLVAQRLNHHATPGPFSNWVRRLFSRWRKASVVKFRQIFVAGLFTVSRHTVLLSHINFPNTHKHFMLKIETCPHGGVCLNHSDVIQSGWFVTTLQIKWMRPSECSVYRAWWLHHFVLTNSYAPSYAHKKYILIIAHTSFGVHWHHLQGALFNSNIFETHKIIYSKHIKWCVLKNFQLNEAHWRLCQWTPKGVRVIINMWCSIDRIVR